MELVSSYKRLEGMLHLLPRSELPQENVAVNQNVDQQKTLGLCVLLWTSQALELRGENLLCL